MPHHVLDVHSKVNDIFPVLATWGEQSIIVKRIKDDKLICSIFIKDLQQLTDYLWDKLSVKLLCLVFKDGSLRMYQPFEKGKLIAFVRTGIKNCDATFWDRIDTTELKMNKTSLNFKQDILNLLPMLSQIPSDDSPILRNPYVSHIDSWRLNKLDSNKTSKPILDIHILHESMPIDKFNIVINAQYILEKRFDQSNHNKIGVSMKKIISIKQAHYYCFYEDGNVVELNTTRLLTESHILPLLETYLTILDYNKLIDNQFNIIKKTNIKTYTDFIHTVCDEAFGCNKLYDVLCDNFLLGTLTEELKDWFKYTIGERNVAQFKENIDLAFKKSLQIMIICTIPTLEKLILLTNKLESLIVACNLLNKNFSLENVPLIQELSSNYQELLKSVITKIQIMTKESNSLFVFTLWLEDMVNLQIKDDYVPKLDMFQDSKYGFQFVQSLDMLLKKKYLDNEKEIVNVDSYKKIIKDCESKLLNINKSHVESILSDTIQLTVHNNFLSVNFPTGFTHFEMLDIVPLAQQPAEMFLYVAKFTQEMGNKPLENQYHVGILTLNYFRIIEDTIIPDKRNILSQTSKIKFVSFDSNEDNSKTHRQLIIVQLMDNSQLYLDVVCQLKSQTHKITFKELELKKKS